MKANLIPAIITGIACFLVFRWLYLRRPSVPVRLILIILGLAAAVPAVLFASNYLLCVPYARWFYEFHASPGAEITSGLAAGLLGIMYASAKLRKDRLNVPILSICTLITAGLVITPFAKQLFSTVNYASLENKWDKEICLQTSSYTCVPACIATLIEMQGGHATEPELAKAFGTTKTGTEIWYTIRALNKLGYKAKFHHTRSLKKAPVPSMVGVNVGDIGHVVILLARDEKGVTIGEPLRGRRKYSWQSFQNLYRPNGSSVTIRRIKR